MAFDEGLASRIRDVLDTEPGVTERRMFGGLAFMVQGNLCVGVLGDELMVRVGPAQYPDALSGPGCRAMDFTGRPMRGMVMVSHETLSEDPDLTLWIQRALTFCRSLPAK